jgi:hypothetical protein
LAAVHCFIKEIVKSVSAKEDLHAEPFLYEIVLRHCNMVERALRLVCIGNDYFQEWCCIVLTGILGWRLLATK